MEDYLYIVTQTDGVDGRQVIRTEYFRTQEGAQTFIDEGPEDMGGQPTRSMRRVEFYEDRMLKEEMIERAEYERLKAKYG